MPDEIKISEYRRDDGLTRVSLSGSIPIPEDGWLGNLRKTEDRAALVLAKAEIRGDEEKDVRNKKLGEAQEWIVTGKPELGRHLS